MRAIRIALAIIVLLVALSLMEQRAVAADQDDFRRALQSALAELERANPDIQEAISRLREIGPVILADGTTIEPDLSAILEELERTPPDIDSARQRIAAILAVLDETVASPALGTSDDPRAVLQQVLARDEFDRSPEEGDSMSLRERLWQAIRDSADWLLRRVPNAGAGAGFNPAPILFLLLVVGIVVAIVLGVRRVMRPRPSAARMANEQVGVRPTARQARAEADRLFQRGEYRAALRALYLATLLHGEEVGRLRFDRSLTNREVLTQVRRRGDSVLIERLTPLVEQFDRVWYRGMPCSAEDYRRFAALADRAWEAA